MFHNIAKCWLIFYGLARIKIIDFCCQRNENILLLVACMTRCKEAGIFFQGGKNWVIKQFGSNWTHSQKWPKFYHQVTNGVLCIKQTLRKMCVPLLASVQIQNSAQKSRFFQVILRGRHDSELELRENSQWVLSVNTRVCSLLMGDLKGWDPLCRKWTLDHPGASFESVRTLVSRKTVLQKLFLLRLSVKKGTCFPTKSVCALQNV